jgi:hypothetical protein
MALRSRTVVGEGVAPAGAAVNALMARNPPRDPSGDYVQPVWLGWQATGASAYRVWLSRQLPRVRNRARLEVACDIEGLSGSRLRGSIRPTGMMWLIVVIPGLLAVFGLTFLTAAAASVVRDPGQLGGLIFALLWYGILVAVVAQFLRAIRQTCDLLLGELSAAIGGPVVAE